MGAVPVAVFLLVLGPGARKRKRMVCSKSARHLQWGHLADELSFCKSAMQALQAETASLRLGLEQEQHARPFGDGKMVENV